MKPDMVSLTQERRAGYRAIAAMDPDGRVRNPDYLAEKFLPPEFWFFGLLVKDYPSTKSFIEAHRISAYYTVNAITWHIDGVLQNIADKGLKQVVHIGAGLDSRPYRFAMQMPDVRFIELDQPATQAQKQKMVRGVFGELPARVTYIPCDYRAGPVFDALSRAGYSERLKTLFIWEGTTMLTERSVVEDTLEAIASRAVSGSELVMDYVVETVVDGDFSRYPGARYEAVESAAKGEPWRFGITEGEAVEFTARSGLALVSDLGADELAGRYLVKGDGSLDGKPAPHYRILHARVR